MSPASAIASSAQSANPRENASLWDTAVRMAASLARSHASGSRFHTAAETAVHSRVRSLGESSALTEHVTVGPTGYRVRGELLEQGAGMPVVLVVVERDPRALLSHNEIRKAYHLTHTEALVAPLLVERMSNREVARALGVTVHTARRHTESVLLKLGVTRRTHVHGELLQRMERGRPGRAPTAHGEGRGARGAGGAGGDEVRDDMCDDMRDDMRDEPHGRYATAVVESGAATRQAIAGEPPRRRGRRPDARHQPKESITVLLAREHERFAVRDALPESVDIRFAERLNDILPPWPGGAPTAVLVDLREVEEKKLERVLRTLRSAAPTTLTWGYTGLERASVQEAVRLAAGGLLVEVITTSDILGARVRALLNSARSRKESDALWDVWRKWAGPEAREILAACIDASSGPTTAVDMARRLNRSLRAIRRDLSRAGLPPVHRVLVLCRLLRAMHRLDHHGVSIKVAGSELGYRYSYSLAHQLHRYTGLTISGTSTGRRFAKLAAFVRVELSRTGDRLRPGEVPGEVSVEARGGARGGTRDRQSRDAGSARSKKRK